MYQRVDAPGGPWKKALEEAGPGVRLPLMGRRTLLWPVLFVSPSPTPCGMGSTPRPRCRVGCGGKRDASVWGRGGGMPPRQSPEHGEDQVWVYIYILQMDISVLCF